MSLIVWSGYTRPRYCACLSANGEKIERSR